MVQGYYTLEESAQILGMSADDLKQLARKGDIRSFQDRGTWRFRIQDIQEMVRQRSDGSDLELATGKSFSPQPTDSPAPRSPKPKTKEEDVFGFSLGAEEEEQSINLGGDVQLDKGPGSSGVKKSSSAKRLPMPGSDSDVRLVPDGGKESGPKSGQRSSKKGLAGPKSPHPGRGEAAAEPVDSGVRLVPLDSDSDVRIVGADSDDVHVPLGEQPPKSATDSDIRLESQLPPARGPVSEGPLTEEINLDEELKKDEARRQQLAQGKPQPQEPDFPKKSPFELSSSDFDLTPAEENKKKDSSSDFELTPANESSSPLELGSSDEFQLNVTDDELNLADDHKTNLKGPMSGIHLDDPADSGISLEQTEGPAADNEFELTLDAESTPKPSKPAPSNLVDEDADSDSSEFELSLDVEGKGKSDSDSEFELTLDDTGGLAPLEPETAAEGEDKDIFETDFEVPALGEESGSEVVAEGDTALESSDFELAIGDDDAIGMEESGSEVVALDEEEMLDEDAAPRSGKKSGKKRADDEGDLAALEEDEVGLGAEDEIGVGGEEPVAAVAAPQAPWGVFPVAVLLPCVVVMMLVGMMGFELMQTQQGYKPGPLTKTISGWVGAKK